MLVYQRVIDPQDAKDAEKDAVFPMAFSVFFSMASHRGHRVDRYIPDEDADAGGASTDGYGR